MKKILNENTNNLLIPFNIPKCWINHKPEFLLCGRAVISDLYLFPETGLLNPCFK